MCTNKKIYRGCAIDIEKAFDKCSKGGNMKSSNEEKCQWQRTYVNQSTIVRKTECYTGQINLKKKVKWRRGHTESSAIYYFNERSGACGKSRIQWYSTTMPKTATNIRRRITLCRWWLFAKLNKKYRKK